MKEKNFLSTSELAEILGISRVAVYKRIKKGDIRAEKVGGSYIIAKDDLGGILKENLSKEEKEEVEKAVKRAVEEYGEVFEKLAKT